MSLKSGEGSFSRPPGFSAPVIMSFRVREGFMLLDDSLNGVG